MPLEEGKQSTIDLQYVGRQRVCQIAGTEKADLLGVPGARRFGGSAPVVIRANRGELERLVASNPPLPSPRTPEPPSPRTPDKAVYGRWLIELATAAAPKPLSILTTETPLAQLFSIPSKAARPPKLAP